MLSINYCTDLSDEVDRSSWRYFSGLCCLLFHLEMRMFNCVHFVCIYLCSCAEVYLYIDFQTALPWLKISSVGIRLFVSIYSRRDDIYFVFWEMAMKYHTNLLRNSLLFLNFLCLYLNKMISMQDRWSFNNQFMIGSFKAQLQRYSS